MPAERMNLAKPRLDVGLYTNEIAPLLRFWQGEVNAAFDHVLPLAPGHDQHRHDISGSVLKLNHIVDPLPPNPPSGYRELMVARDRLKDPVQLVDPEGNLVSLVPVGHEGIDQIGIRLAVRDVEAHCRFYAEALGLVQCPRLDGAAFRAGESMVLLDEASDAPVDATIPGSGWRYITFQVFKVDVEHRRILEHGGHEAMAPQAVGTIARVSVVRDPDGNWIELSQRASIVGSLGP